jgi:hypothetical protein
MKTTLLPALLVATLAGGTSGIAQAVSAEHGLSAASAQTPATDVSSARKKKARGTAVRGNSGGGRPGSGKDAGGK